MIMTQEEIIKYKNLYVQTARAYLNDIQHHIALLLKEPHNKDAVEIVHMAAHSLGSQSVMMEYKSIGTLSRLIEKIFRDKKDKASALDSEILVTINACLKRMVVSVYEIEMKNKELDLSVEITQLEQISGVKPEI